MVKRVFCFENVIFCFLAFVFACIVISPAIYAKECLLGIEMWARFVLPALFPFFFITKILTSFSLVTKFSNAISPIGEKLFHAPKVTPYIMLMSYISGYPLGAKLLSDFYDDGILSSEDVANVSILCSTSGIPFVLGSVGGLMLENQSVALVIYFSQILASIAIGFMFRKKTFAHKKIVAVSKPKNIDNLLSESITSSIMSVLIVGGYIALFYVILKVFSMTNILNPLENALNKIFLPLEVGDIGNSLIKGVFEVTSGCKALSQLPNKNIAGGLMSFLIGFGGLSINMQALTFLSHTKINKAKFLLKKVLQGILSAIIYCAIAFAIL